ncbi:protein-tyrosine phosphatase family protein [Pleionea sediminis]|uniref:protein-tyrosine phosphatase family protein n=1 Tax=Pleionea sediminis TaxID=2569479 RepID=UPI0011872C2A|nr:hypothetical protein [Pleionea sediminis]
MTGISGLPNGAANNIDNANFEGIHNRQDHPQSGDESVEQRQSGQEVTHVGGGIEIESVASAEVLNNPLEGSKIFERSERVDDNLIRSSAPHYNSGGPRFDEVAINELISAGVTHVISFNENEKPDVEALEKAGIKFSHFKTKDFTAPDIENLKEAASLISEGELTELYCGYGHGRTGTAVTAYQIYNGDIKTEAQLDQKMSDNHVETSAQKAVLKELLEQRLNGAWK